MFRKLLKKQLQTWPLATTNFAALDAVLQRQISNLPFSTQVQFNPSRKQSSAAKTDTISIQERACFLCGENQPKEQLSERLVGYRVQVNPFPIFKEHFTISAQEHTPQRIDERLADMLQLSVFEPNFTLFYNGAQCGASAPDHMHFQACTKGVLPIESELGLLVAEFGSRLQSMQSKAWKVADGARNFFVFNSNKPECLLADFKKLYIQLQQQFGLEKGEEPPMNVICSMNKHEWQLIVFPRKKQRPRQFYAEGKEHIMVSPASVEMAGLLIMPLEKDYKKLTATDVKSVLQQVSLSDDEFAKLFQS